MDAIKEVRLDCGIHQHHFKVGLAQRSGKRKQTERRTEGRSVVWRIKENDFAARQQATSAGSKGGKEETRFPEERVEFSIGLLINVVH
jgi:hypothetical protein